MMICGRNTFAARRTASGDHPSMTWDLTLGSLSSPSGAALPTTPTIDSGTRSSQVRTHSLLRVPISRISAGTIPYVARSSSYLFR